MIRALTPGIAVDLFAGGGGASLGMQAALGRPIDEAINHDWRAIAVHEANHPETRHWHTDVWEVHPLEATRGRHVSCLWASPDCTFYSKARGGKPFRDRAKANRRRALATVVVFWAREARPDVIFMENVEEFAKWGPLDRKTGLPDAARSGLYFRRWKAQLERLGYRVDYRNLVASDYGAPTSRKRLFLVARCDGRPIVWPEPTHGPWSYQKPVRTAAEIIDWSIESQSIFDRARPLADATMRRIARGVVEKCILDPRPFIAAAHTIITRSQGERPGQAPRVPGLDQPLGTVVAQGKKHALVTAHLSNFYGDGGQLRDVRRPAPTITAGGQHTALVSAFLARHWGSMADPRKMGVPRRLDAAPWPTITTKACQDQLVEVLLAREFDRSGEVRAFLMKYYGQGGQWSRCDEPMHTVRTKACMGLVTVEGAEYAITDIRMRMLTPRELFRAQGFPEWYNIAPLVDRSLSAASTTLMQLNSTDQVFLCGNSVSPPVAEALVRANMEAS